MHFYSFRNIYPIIIIFNQTILQSYKSEDAHCERNFHATYSPKTIQTSFLRIETSFRSVIIYVI